MLLDLLAARGMGDPKGPGPIIMVIAIVLGIILLPIAACTRGCKPKPDLATIHKAWVSQTLGGQGTVTVAQVYPPVGPWDLVRRGSYHYKATVQQTGKTIWAEAYVSNWTAAYAVLGGTDPVYRYRYWGETKVLGRTFYPTIDR